jgi:hypothetical protein
LRQQLSAIALRHYDDLNLSVTRDTFPAFHDADVTRPPTTLVSGGFSTVFSVLLRDARGAQVEGVFKPLRSTADGWVTERTVFRNVTRR